ELGPARGKNLFADLKQFFEFDGAGFNVGLIDVRFKRGSLANARSRVLSDGGVVADSNKEREGKGKCQQRNLEQSHGWRLPKSMFDLIYPNTVDQDYPTEPPI